MGWAQDGPAGGEVSYGRSAMPGTRCADGAGDGVLSRGPAAPVQGRVPRSARAGGAVRRGGAMWGEVPEGSGMCAVAPWPEGHGTVFVVDAGTGSATVRVR
ncbi:hypothetical protein AB852_03865 [Streptomyces uncialis]|uniref:Uncharacterized protein n=1 Tax=Streptomyces uncialis TaxID=1048205 RepID=A0A1Q4VDK3_9ACTN|nr:hypothetical protein AB852_03865 [Streptomyces uncialis]